MTANKITLKDKYKIVLETIKKYPDQLKQSWDEINEMEFPENYRDIYNVVVCGMGGSALGARIVDSLITDCVRVPIEIFNQYNVPFYAGEKTLIIVSSYSGGTEETLSSFKEASERGAKIIGITTGGKLANLLTEKNFPRYVFEPGNNPSKQPRMAIGYSVGAILAILSKLELIYLSVGDFEEGLSVMRESAKKNEDSAKTLAQKLSRKAPILIASEHLTGVAYTIKNQLNESAKTFSALFELPELNHHLMEGLVNPEKLKEVFHFVLFESTLYTKRVSRRYSLTKDVIEKNGYKHSTFVPRSDKKLSQVLETLVFGSLVAYHIAKSKKIDPTVIPWVDYFKKKLAKK